MMTAPVHIVQKDTAVSEKDPAYEGGVNVPPQCGSPTPATDNKVTARVEILQNAPDDDEFSPLADQCFEADLNSRRASPTLNEATALNVRHHSNPSRHAKEATFHSTLDGIPKEAVEGTNDYTSCSKLEAHRNDSVVSEGEARPQAEEMRLVRVTRQERKSCACRGSKFVVPSVGCIEPQKIILAPYGGSPSHKQWKEAIDTGAEKAEARRSESFASARSRRQERIGWRHRWVSSSKANEEFRTGTYITQEPRGDKLGMGKPLEQQQEPLKLTEQGSSAALAVQALEKAQKEEEKRLLLLEFSHCAIESHAENRRRESTLQERCLRPDSQKSTRICDSSMLHQQLKQDKMPTPVLKLPRAPSGGAEASTSERSSKAACISRQKASRQPSPLHRFLERVPSSFGQGHVQQRPQDTAATCRPPSNPPSVSAGRNPAQVADFTSGIEERSITNSVAIHKRLSGKQEDTNSQPPRFKHKAPMQQQELLHRRPCQFVNAQIPSGQRRREDVKYHGNGRCRLVLALQDGEVLHLPATNIQRTEALQVLERLLLPEKATSSECAFASVNAQRESELSTQSQQQSRHHQQIKNQRLSAFNATASIGSGSYARGKKYSYLSSLSNSLKTVVPSMHWQLKEEHARPLCQQLPKPSIFTIPSSSQASEVNAAARRTIERQDVPQSLAAGILGSLKGGRKKKASRREQRGQPDNLLN